MVQIVLPNRFTPRNYQAGMMNHFDATQQDARFVAVLPRRAGKDLTMIHQTAKEAMQHVGVYYHMLPTHKQCRKVVWDGITNDGENFVEQAFPPAIVASKHEAEMKVHLINGSIWQAIGSDNFNSVVGSNPRGLVFSEFALTDPRAWGYFRPILRANRGWASFISTPRGYNQLWEMLEVAKKEVALGNRKWGYMHASAIDLGIMTEEDIEEEIRQGMPRALANQEFRCDFAAANVGAILGDLLNDAMQKGRIHEGVSYTKGQPVIVSMDLGFRDTTAAWFWQYNGAGFDLIYFDQASGLDADDWIDRLGNLSFPIDELWLPHDARARTFRTRDTVFECLARSKVARQVAIIPRTSITDRINAARKVLKYCSFNNTTCAEGLSGLRAWSYEYNEETRMFSQSPRHDWASHPGDAFSYGAQVLHEYRMKRVGEEEAKQAPQGYKLQEMFEDRERGMGRIIRI